MLLDEILLDFSRLFYYNLTCPFHIGCNKVGGKSVQKRKQLGVFAAVLILVLVATQLQFLGCAGTQPKELTPEQKQAIADSLANVHKRRLALLWSLGYEPYKQADYQKAKGYFRQVANLDTTGVYGRILYQLLGDTYLRLNQPDSAEWVYLIGIGRLPDNPYFAKALGYIYRAGGRTEDAIEMYEKLVTLEPDSSGHFVNLGELYVSAEETDRAIESYQTAVQLDPSNNRAQEVLSTLLSQTGDIDRVIETQENLVASEPGNMKYKLDLAQSYHRAGLFEQAIGQLTVVFENNPDDIVASELLGDSYQQVEQFQDAVNIYTQILKSRPDDKKNMCNLAMSNTSLGRFMTAMRQVQQVIRQDRNYGLAYLTRGMIYETSADRCVEKNDSKVTFDDKLVYKLAYDEFTRAKQDLEWKNDAERRLRYLETLIPTREDLFMHKDQTTPRGECYEWIR